MDNEVMECLNRVCTMLEDRVKYWHYQYQDEARATAYDSALVMLTYAMQGRNDMLDQFDYYGA